MTTVASWNPRELRELAARLLALRGEMLEAEATQAERLAALPRGRRESARNLLHYLALRANDVRDLQERLAAIGLSSLGRTESHALGSLDAVIEVLHAMIGKRWRRPDASAIGFSRGSALLAAHTQALLGPAPPGRTVRILVTMPGEAAGDYALVRSLLADGMDAMRINCAHDDPAAWGRMTDHLERAQREVGRPCRVLMDLGGPKLRTGSIVPVAGFLRLDPKPRDGVAAPSAALWLTPAESPEPPPAGAGATLRLPERWLRRLRADEALVFDDARGKTREVRCGGSAGRSRSAVLLQSAEIDPGALLALRRGSAGHRVGRAGAKAEVIPGASAFVRLHVGDRVVLVADPGAETPRPLRARGRPPAARVGCSLPEIFDDLRAGERISFDDGRVGGVIRTATADGAEIEIVRAREMGEKLRSEKGINLPDSTLRLPALTARDLDDLSFVARHADAVGLSFASRREDVRTLRTALADRDAAHLGIVLKIETRRGFERLPGLLLEALPAHAVGVMIARGDLAVELGYERLAEAQEEILWICEAAHVPVIWATQVLENLAKNGLPSRAEITDAAMGERAECVMLNKGPHVRDAVRLLDDILRRMQSHQRKKRAMLRRLHFSPTLI